MGGWSCEIQGDVPTLSCIGEVVVRVVNALLLFAGAIALGFIIWGGIRFILSSGDPKALGSAKNTLTFAIAGLILILTSFAIINFLGNFLGLPPNQLLKFGFGQ